MTSRARKTLFILGSCVVCVVVLLLFVPVTYSVSFASPVVKQDMMDIFSSQRIAVKHVEFRVGTGGGGAGLDDLPLADALARVEVKWAEANDHIAVSGSEEELNDFYGEEATQNYFDELMQNRTLFNTEGLRYGKAHVRGSFIHVIGLKKYDQVGSVQFDGCRNILIHLPIITSCG